MAVELDDTVQEGNQEVGEMEGQKDCWADVWSYFVH